MIVLFKDMSSGGARKTNYSCIFIVASDQDTAIEVFTRMFQDPDRVTCECCGADYDVIAYETWEEVTRIWREGHETPEAFLARPDVFIHEVARDGGES